MRIQRARGNVAAGCVLGAWVALALIATPIKADTHIRLSLRSSYPAASVGFLLAIERGYYEEAGLAIEVVAIGEPGAGEERAGEFLTSGVADLAIGGTDVLVETVPTDYLVAVFSAFQTSAGRLYLKSDRTISSITQLPTLPIVLPLDGSRLATEVEAMLAINGIPLASLETVVVPPGEGAVAALRSDDVAGFPGSLISTEFVLDLVGIEVVPIDPGSYGLDFYGDTVFATRAWAESHAAEVEQFRIASLRGWEDAFADPEATADWLVATFDLPAVIPRSVPERDFVIWQLERVRELTGYPVVDVGYTSAIRWGRIVSALDELGMANPGVVHDRFVFDYDRIIEAQRAQRSAGVILALSALVAAVTVALLLKYLSERGRLRAEMEQLFHGLLHGVGYFRRVGERYHLVRCNGQLQAAARIESHAAGTPSDTATDVLTGLGIEPDDAATLLATMASDRAVVKREVRSPTGGRLYEVSLFPLAAHTIGIASLDVTSRETATRALEAVVHQRTVTIREIHHRVRNNMQIITSLMRLQVDHLQTEEARRFQQKLDGQIRSLSVAHEMLYEDFIEQTIDICDYLWRIARDTVDQYNQSSGRTPVTCGAPGDDVRFPAPLDTAIPLGLIVHEAVTNSCHHAFGATPRPPHVAISCVPEADGRLTLEITDNGEGIADSQTRASTFGLQIMGLLAEQVGATTVVTSDDAGTRVQVDLRV